MTRLCTAMTLLVLIAACALCAGCATQEPGQPTPGATGTVTPAATGTTTVQVALRAVDIAFNTSTITVPAGSAVVMTFVNDDAGVPHNYALYTDSTAATSIFRGEVVTGPTTTTYTFTAPAAPGTYFFRCDPHPDTMTGSFVVT